eukprot:jgi/Orpsp1_1/1188323/evm.model.d7180000063914.1
MVKLIFDYAKKNDVFMYGIERSSFVMDYPLLSAILNNNVEMVQLIINFAIENGLSLEFNENDIYNDISKKYENSVKNISEINIEIIKLLYKNNNEDKMEITFNEK